MRSYSKEEQLKTNKKEVIKAPWGRRKSRGDFGMKKCVIKAKPTRVKKTDVIDDDFTNWLCTQSCVVTGQVSERGLGAYNMHGHHIYSRYPSRNDYLQVPLMGFVHNVGSVSYHTHGYDKFISYYNIDLGEYETIKEWFYSMVQYFVSNMNQKLG